VAAEQYLVVGILILGAGLAKIAERYKFPYPIPLILGGLVLGQLLPGFGLPEIIGIEFIAQLTLATVLFYAGLTMNLKELRLSLPVVALLATVGVILTSLIAGFAIALVFSTVGLTGLLIGAILTPTDPAALFSVLETGGMRVKRKLFSILEGEAVFNDATAVILVITVFEPLIIPALQVPWFFVIEQFFFSIFAGVAIGYLVAAGIGRGILSSNDPVVVTILTATTPIIAYGLGETLTVFGFHPGAMAAVFAGIFMANAKRMGLEILPQQSMRSTMKNVSFAFEIVVFILLGYEINLAFLLTELVPGVTVLSLSIVVALLVIFVARPISVFLITSPHKELDMKDRFFVSWAGVKGVASAALATISVSILTDYLPATEETIFLASFITSVVFVVLMASLIIQGLTAPIFAEKLGLQEEEHAFEEISTQRDATRRALLHLVDEYTEGKISEDLYLRLKAELEEDIYRLEDELRKLVEERRSRLMELTTREEISREKLKYYKEQYEQGKIPESVYEDKKAELEEEIEELCVKQRHCEEG
jgi:NhaP-type Na+/H+ or K+/H+ antiporter